MSIICEEVFDESSHPSAEEIRDYATKIGIDPDAESHLLPLAEEGLMKALPAGWKPCYDKHSKSYYYFNKTTSKTQWEHPLDEVYRTLVKKNRLETQSSSNGEPTEDATIARDEIPSYEETTTGLDRNPSRLGPPKIPTKLPPLRPLHQQQSHEVPISKNVHTLKYNTESPNSAKNAFRKPPEKFETRNEDSPKRSILREKTGVSLTPNITNKEDDDRKSVRFQLNENPDVAFTFSEQSSTTSDKEEKVPTKRNTININIPSAEYGVKKPEEVFKPSSAWVQHSSIQKMKAEVKDNSEESFSVSCDDRKPNSIESKKSESVEQGKNLMKQMSEDFDKKKLDAKRNEDRNGESLKHQNKLKEVRNGLEEHFKEEERVMRQQFESKKEELEKYYDEKLASIEKELAEEVDRKKEELVSNHEAYIEALKDSHATIIESTKKKYDSEELAIKQSNFTQDRSKKLGLMGIEQSLDKQLVTEKKLLEEKYSCLKEKYLKLKQDIKASMDKRSHKKELAILQCNAGSETEASQTSHKHTNFTETENKLKQLNNNKSSEQLSEASEQGSSQVSALPQKSNEGNEFESSDNSSILHGRSRKKLFTRAKSSSTSRLGNVKSPKYGEASTSYLPVTNLRQQLKKLEDLEDQLPHTVQQQEGGDTYRLRYPFRDDQPNGNCSELEFFRHRVHLERDSIKRAKEGLQNQKTLFQQRHQELKLKYGTTARHALQKLYQEEKELSDMEVNLHRTRSLLGEKVIRLRHLESSLRRASSISPSRPNLVKKDEATLSDMSSHSASSGISSTEFVPVENFQIHNNEKFQESSEIIQNLESLNLEIREIWEVLRGQQQQSPVAPALLYPDFGWPCLSSGTVAPPSIPTLADRLSNFRHHLALANAQTTMVTHANQGATTSLIERTKNLKQWLRQSCSDEATASQTTL